MAFYRHQLSMLRCVSMCVSFVKHHELAHWARIWRNVSSLFYLSYADAEQTMKYILQDSFMNRLQLECYNDITSVNNWFSFFFGTYLCVFACHHQSLLMPDRVLWTRKKNTVILRIQVSFFVTCQDFKCPSTDIHQNYWTISEHQSLQYVFSWSMWSMNREKLCTHLITSLLAADEDNWNCTKNISKMFKYYDSLWSYEENWPSQHLQFDDTLWEL